MSKPEQQTHGLGYNVCLEGMEVPKLQEMAKRIMTHVRRAGAAPIDAHRRLTWQVGKKNGMPKTRGIMILHGFDGMWRCYYRGTRKIWRRLQRPSYACGCRSKHRREAAMMAAMITSWRLVKAGLSFAARSHDMTNAFPSSKREVLDRLDRGYNDPEEALMLAHRSGCMVARLTALYGTLQVLAAQEGFMGDGNAPDDFMGVGFP